jgi:hypothetical protein
MDATKKGMGRMAAKHRKRSRARVPKIVSIGLGTILAGVAALAATNWIIGLTSTSHGQAKSMSVVNLTVSAISSPTPATLLYPGSTGTVVIKISNLNTFPVTVTGFDLPTTTTYAAGYTTASLADANITCAATGTTASLVYWRDSTPTPGTAVTLTTAVTLAKDSTLTVTLTGDALMRTASPEGCESTYFSMPSFTGVIATSASAGTTVTSATYTDSFS